MASTCAYNDQLIEIRRHLHTMPEEGWSEFRTTAFIIETLRSYGYEVLTGKKVINPDNCLGRSQKVVDAGFAPSNEWQIVSPNRPTPTTFPPRKASSRPVRA